MLKRGSLWMLILFFSAGCGIINIKKSGNAAERFDNYSEDLSESRIAFSDIPEPKESTTAPREARAGAGNAVDADLEEAMIKYAENKREEPYFSGFTILVYSGVDRDLAFKTRNELYSAFPDIKTDMQYEQPRYLVKVGKYINRIEALHLFEKIKQQFPSSRIIQDRFKRDIEEKEIELERGDQ